MGENRQSGESLTGFLLNQCNPFILNYPPDQWLFCVIGCFLISMEEGLTRSRLELG